MAENNSSAPLKTAEGAAHQLLIALHTIAAYPVTNLQMNMDAANMQRIAAQAVEAQAAPAAVAVPSVVDTFSSCAIADSNYAAGMLLGWNLCVTDDSETFSRIRSDRMSAAIQASRAARATPEPPATEDSSAGDLAEVQAEPVALQMCSDLKPRTESEKAAYLAGVADGRMYAERDADTAPQAQPADALDAARLMFLMDETDGFVIVEKDKYDFAIECAVEAGREEPTAADELNGVRRLLDAAMAAAQEGGNAAKEV